MQEPQEGRLTYSIVEAAKVLGIGRNSMLRLAKNPEFPAVQVGRKWIISKNSLHKWVDGITKN
ncbi:MAG: helix-turn-helix domain-containing protein [Dethiobacteria bacterium]|jgi:excisionase family DNA binding protein